MKIYRPLPLAMPAPLAEAAQLVAAETRFQATFEQAAVGIAHVAPDGCWLRVNQRLCEIVGYSRDELMGKSFQDITHPDDLEADLAYAQRILNGELTHYAMEKRYFRKGGAVVWINLTVSLVWRAPGVPDYFISVVEDISKRKAAEQEIELLSQSLVQIQEAERQFMALELHDEVGQRLSAIKICLGVARQQCQEPAVRALIEQTRDMAASLIVTIRDMAQRLRPPQLDDFGLRAAVAALVEELGSQLDLTLTLEENVGDRRFPAAVELAGYRVVQEALSNVLRHARCQCVTVSLWVGDTGLSIRIVDDGIGFDPQVERRPQTLGLIGMRERSVALGGQFRIESPANCGNCGNCGSSVSGGTSVSVLLPVPSS